MTSHLSLHDIFAIRDEFAAHAEDPERFELVNWNGLVSALTTPFQSTFGEESFPSLIDKAAALTFLLIANHPFRDGNKRIAGAALQLFLQRNGLHIAADDTDLEALTMLVARSHLRDDQITAWIAARTIT
jgi:death-on-curing protein